MASKFKTVCDEYEIPPQDLYNFDESRSRIGVDCNQWVVARIFDCTLSFGSNTDRELATICETKSGGGYVLPPVITSSGAIHRSGSLQQQASVMALAVSGTGYSSDILSLEWLKHFERFTAKRQHGLYRLLCLMDVDRIVPRSFLIPAIITESSHFPPSAHYSHSSTT